MSAPFLWIVLPLILSGGLLLVARWKRAAALIGSGFALLFALLAWLLPVGRLIQIGILSLELPASLSFFGRRLIVENSERPLIILINLTIAFWSLGSPSTRVQRLFIPLAMAIGAILLAVVLVQPLYYGSILFLLGVLVSIVLLVSEEKEVNAGIKRYWIFQSFAMPLVLLGGWLVSGMEAIPAARSPLSLIYFLFLIGLSLLLSGVPFQSWLPAVAQSVNVYSFSFAFFSLSLFSHLFIINLLKQTPWLFSSPWLVVFFSLQGFLLCLFGGVGAIYHRHLGRWVGYTSLKELGLSLLILGLGFGSGERSVFLAILFMQLLPRGIALALLAYALNVYHAQRGSLRIGDLVGVGRQYPFATLAYFIATLTLVGFPITASFPIHLLVWQAWFQQLPAFAIGAILGSIGVLIGGLRALAVFVRGEEMQSWVSHESREQVVLLTISALLLLLFGLFPQWFSSLLFNWGLGYFQGG